jgi:hypothetical protein
MKNSGISYRNARCHNLQYLNMDNEISGILTYCRSSVRCVHCMSILVTLSIYKFFFDL